MKIKSQKAKKNIWRIITYTLCIIILLMCLFPFIWMFITSLKTPKDAFALPPKWIFSPIWKHYFQAWLFKGFAKSFFNTIIVGIATVTLGVVLALPMAYSLARYKLKGLSILSMWFLVIRMLPELLFIIPLFMIYRWLGLYDTLLGLILAFQIYNLPFAVWLLKGFITQIPKEIEDAGSIDGCGELGILFRIVVPSLLPGLVAVSSLMFITVWVYLLFPLCLTYQNAKIIPTAIAAFKGYGAFNWPIMASGCVIASIPPLIFFVVIHKYIVAGLTLGAVKG